MLAMTMSSSPMSPTSTTVSPPKELSNYAVVKLKASDNLISLFQLLLQNGYSQVSFVNSLNQTIFPFVEHSEKCTQTTPLVTLLTNGNALQEFSNCLGAIDSSPDDSSRHLYEKTPPTGSMEGGVNSSSALNNNVGCPPPPPPGSIQSSALSFLDQLLPQTLASHFSHLINLTGVAGAGQQNGGFVDTSAGKLFLGLPTMPSLISPGANNGLASSGVNGGGGDVVVPSLPALLPSAKLLAAAAATNDPLLTSTLLANATSNIKEAAAAAAFYLTDNFTSPPPISLKNSAVAAATSMTSSLQRQFMNGNVNGGHATLLSKSLDPVTMQRCGMKRRLVEANDVVTPLCYDSVTASSPLNGVPTTTTATTTSILDEQLPTAQFKRRHVTQSPAGSMQTSMAACLSQATNTQLRQRGQRGYADDPSMYVTCRLCKNRIMGSRVSNLTNHVRRHSSLKQFQCCYCEYTHNEMAKVRLHMLHNHKDKDSQPIDNLSPEMQSSWEYLMKECFPDHVPGGGASSSNVGGMVTGGGGGAGGGGGSGGSGGSSSQAACNRIVSQSMNHHHHKPSPANHHYDLTTANGMAVPARRPCQTTYDNSNVKDHPQYCKRQSPVVDLRQTANGVVTSGGTANGTDAGGLIPPTSSVYESPQSINTTVSSSVGSDDKHRPVNNCSPVSDGECCGGGGGGVGGGGGGDDDDDDDVALARRHHAQPTTQKNGVIDHIRRQPGDSQQVAQFSEDSRLPCSECNETVPAKDLLYHVYVRHAKSSSTIDRSKLPSTIIANGHNNKSNGLANNGYNNSIGNGYSNLLGNGYGSLENGHIDQEEARKAFRNCFPMLADRLNIFRRSTENDDDDDDNDDDHHHHRHHDDDDDDVDEKQRTVASLFGDDENFNERKGIEKQNHKLLSASDPTTIRPSILPGDPNFQDTAAADFVAKKCQDYLLSLQKNNKVDVENSRPCVVVTKNQIDDTLDVVERQNNDSVVTTSSHRCPKCPFSSGSRRRMTNHLNLRHGADCTPKK